MEMAKSVRQIAESNIGVGITGNAGPTATGNAQVGEVWVAVDYLGEVYSYHLQLKQLSREEVIEQTVKVVYSMLNQLLKK
jgi:nicotinamide mononucleotide (NMN) deamidase PncC